MKLEEMREPNQAWTVDDLRHKLQVHLSAREAVDRRPVKDSESPENKEDTRSRSTYGFKPKAATEMLASNEIRRPAVMKCVYCHNAHWSDECKQYTTIDERKRRLKGKCFNCLSKLHTVNNCKIEKPCYYCSRKSHHHRSLCREQFRQSKVQSNKECANVASEDSTSADTATSGKTKDTEVTSNTRSDSSLLTVGEHVLLQTAMVGIMNPHNRSIKYDSRIVMDCCSSRSYISKGLAQKLKLDLQDKEVLSVNTFGNAKAKDVETNRAEICLQTKDGGFIKLTVNVVPQITGTVTRSAVELTKYAKIWKNLQLADTLPIENEATSVQVLIGNDYYMDVITAEKLKITHGMYLLGSVFGWIITERFQSEELSIEHNSYSMLALTYSNTVHQQTMQHGYVQMDTCLPLSPNMEDFWRLETIGIYDSPSVQDDDVAIENFNKTVSFENCRYQVTWPWKALNPDLPDNWALALKRYQSYLKKLQQTPEFLKKYYKIMRDQLEKGIIEKIDKRQPVEGALHYIPHHPVITPDKTTTKVRIVYDASAKSRKGNNSLNDCLMRGPVILADLCGLLLRFRLGKIAIVADIEKAFLQVSLQEQERDVTRFLWINSLVEIDENSPQIYRFCRVPFGVISSPFLLGITVSHHLKQFDTPVSNQIRNNMYVDNLVTAVKSESQAKLFYEEANNIFKQAGMNLREWLSNSKDVMNFISEEDKVKLKTVKILGIEWHTEEDVLAVPGPKATSRECRTKRDVLKHLAQIFDPLGFFGPITIRAKIFLHELWQMKLEWDDQLNAAQNAKWGAIEKELNKISLEKVTRYVGTQENDVEYMLICFCDASIHCYTAVVYLRSHTTDNTVVNLVFSKTRLTPSAKTSIPRLELLAMLIGFRMVSFVEKQIRLPIEKKIIWTDSKCVLRWLKTTKNLTVFVENRIKEIKSDSSIFYRYVHIEENPADMCTRGKEISELTDLWWKGPNWLSKPEEEWKARGMTEISDKDFDFPEKKKNSASV